VKRNRILRIGLVVLWGCLATTPLLAAPAKTPTQSYLDFHAALQKAKTLDEVLPYLSTAYRSMLESQPKSDRGVWLGRLKDMSNGKDLKITKETINGDACTLEGTATSARGNAMKGKISMVKEGGAWKLDEEGWAT
jgi:hypothetical protein